MSFRNPDLLAYVPVACLLLALTVGSYALRRKRLAHAFGGSAATLRLTGVDLARFPRLRLPILLIAAAVLGLAAAEPRFGGPEKPAVEAEEAPPLDVVLAIDISRSMAAADVGEPRLARAKDLAREILDGIPSERVGLVAFAYEAYAVLPPTTDHELVIYFLEALGTELMSEGDQGSRLSEALERSLELLREEGRDEAMHAIVLISDGEAHEERLAIRGALEPEGEARARVITVAVGSDAGAPVMRVDTRGGAPRPFLDARGETVLSRRNAGLLRLIAQQSGGAYVDGQESDAVDAIMQALGTVRGTDEPSSSEGSQAPDLAFWLGLVALTTLVLDGFYDGRTSRAREATG